MKIGDTIYHCSIIDKTNQEYNIPKPYTLKFNYLTIQPVSGGNKIESYGDDINNIWIAMANAQVFNGVFKENDLLYIDEIIPSNDEEWYGEKANAEITSIRNQNKYIYIEIHSRVSNE